MQNLTSTEFGLLSLAQQIKYARVSGNLVDGEVVDISTLSETTAENENTSTKSKGEYELEGPSIWMNMSMKLKDKNISLAGIKITNHSYCMKNWDKNSKRFTEENAEIMMLINTIKKHGANAFNELIKENKVQFEVSYWLEGETPEIKEDLFASLFE